MQTDVVSAAVSVIMWGMMSLSKHLVMMGVKATGRKSFRQLTALFFFGSGTMVASWNYRLQ